jgi:hypothetical protein
LRRARIPRRGLGDFKLLGDARLSRPLAAAGASQFTCVYYQQVLSLLALLSFGDFKLLGNVRLSRPLAAAGASQFTCVC